MIFPDTSKTVVIGSKLSLSLRFLMKREPYGFPFFVSENQLLAFLTH
jgi:hypothetical protein